MKQRKRATKTFWVCVVMSVALILGCSTTLYFGVKNDDEGVASLALVVSMIGIMGGLCFAGKALKEWDGD